MSLSSLLNVFVCLFFLSPPAPPPPPLIITAGGNISSIKLSSDNPPLVMYKQRFVKVCHHKRVSENQPVSHVPRGLHVEAPDSLGDDGPLDERLTRSCRRVTRPHKHVDGLDDTVRGHLSEAPVAAQLPPEVAVLAKVGRHEFHGNGDTLEGSVGGEEEGRDAVGLKEETRKCNEYDGAHLNGNSFI
jgi:hypothetical protein